MKLFFKNLFFKCKFGILTFTLFLIILLFDLITKSITDGESVTLISGVLSFISSYNTGGAWSLMENHTWLLILLSCVFIAVILVANYLFKNKTILYSISVGLIFGGAIGNLVDRIFLGYVRDFISLDFINFPIFNIADISICVGIALLFIFLIFFANKNKEQKKSIEVKETNND